MPVLRFPHIPTRFASGGWLTTRAELSNPSTRQRHPLSPRPCGLCLSLSRALGAQLAIARVIAPHAATSRRKRNVSTTKEERRFRPHASSQGSPGCNAHENKVICNCSLVAYRWRHLTARVGWGRRPVELFLGP
jgi:hypothetical protein